jgi:uncharacterized iron-regulated membrane protein
VTPRALFPDKPPVPDDSAVTEYYTGIYILGESTSISIGYVGELYIDFGFFGSILVAGLLGFGVGFSARKIALHPGNGPVVTYASLLVIAMPLNILASSLLTWWGRGPQAEKLFGAVRRVARPANTRL